MENSLKIKEAQLPFDNFEKVETSIKDYKTGTFGVEFEVGIIENGHKK